MEGRNRFRRIRKLEPDYKGRPLLARTTVQEYKAQYLLVRKTLPCLGGAVSRLRWDHSRCWLQYSIFGWW